MAKDTLTVGLTRRSIREVLNFAGFDCPVGDRPELQDKEPLTETNLMIVLKDEMDEVFSGLFRRTEFALKAQVRELTRQELAKALSEKDQGKKSPAESILLDIVDNLPTESHRQTLEAFSVLLYRSMNPDPSAFDPESWRTFALGLSKTIDMCFEAQDGILDKAWDRFRGPKKVA